MSQEISDAVGSPTVHASVGDITTVSLGMMVTKGTEVGTEAMVLIPAPVVVLLTEFGWTPPDGAEVREGVMHLERQIHERGCNGKHVGGCLTMNL